MASFAGRVLFSFLLVTVFFVGICSSESCIVGNVPISGYTDDITIIYTLLVY